MPRKRKARAVEAPQEPEPEPVQLEEADQEQFVTEETQQIVEEDPAIEEGVGDEAVEEEQEGEELSEGEGGEGEGEGEEEGEEEQEDDAVFENNEQESEIAEKPSENDALTNGGEAVGQEEEDEGELEEEPLEKLLDPFSKDQLARLIKDAVDKHSDIMEDVNKLANADPSHRKIFVHGLGWNANTELITSVFGKFGEIEDCKVVMDKNSGKAKGYAFVLYKNRDGARRALMKPQKMIEGRITSCQLASAGPVQAPPPTVVTTVAVPPPSEYTQRKIYVSNVSAELDVSKLVEFFSKFGEIEEGPLGLDKETGKPRGFCLFVYRTIDGAKRALEEPHKKFEGQILHCQKAVDGPKLSKASLNLHHSQPMQQQIRPQHHHHNRHQGQLGHYHHAAKRGKFGGGRGGMRHAGGHLMAPSAGTTAPAVGFGHAVPPAAIGQAVAALLATQGASLGIGNLLGGIGTGVNQQGGPPMMNNAAYAGQAGASSYVGQPGLQGGYTAQPQMGQGGVRPHQGGAPYMGHGL
ncbi:hypothetical protein F511_05736 [Dorcoceras hygrometricum]|uniref:RRM domain-containing protein n=1 Tax=Dorcoceras hygrometricum TaxID=472368 RepID=A0A2Z7B965_9LAMI|nr:hypothetical protein F511_05736 [Dorcoceras hygrometricum]